MSRKWKYRNNDASRNIIQVNTSQAATKIIGMSGTTTKLGPWTQRTLGERVED